LAVIGPVAASVLSVERALPQAARTTALAASSAPSTGRLVASAISTL